MATSIFDVPIVLPAERASVLLSALHEIWFVQSGARPGPLESDLEMLRTFFDPRTPGRTVRSALERLETTKPPPPGFDSLVLTVDDARYLVTPEGRLMIDLLEASDRTEPEVVIIRDELAD